MDCLFCKIINKTIPAETVYEDERTLAILDVKPKAPGHTMVLPKVHVETVLDLPDEEIEPFFKAVKHVTALINRGLQPDGFTLGFNHRVGQAVDHLHFHIIPRWHSDGGTSLHGVVDNPPKETMKQIKNKIIPDGQ